MTAPGLAFRLLAVCVAAGAVLGLWYDFLSPLRPRHTAAADLAFLGVSLAVWVYMSFGICGGDLRMGYLLGVAAGGALWRWGPGRLVRPLFRGFWRIAGEIFRRILLPVKKFLKFLKIMFASAKKWVTIE